jgi:hypothetical protein
MGVVFALRSFAPNEVVLRRLRKQFDSAYYLAIISGTGKPLPVKIYQLRSVVMAVEQ